MGPAEDGAKSNPGQPVRRPRPNPNAKAQGGDEVGVRGNQPPLPLVENGRVVERVTAAEQKTLTRRYTDRAVAFIAGHKDRPFFLYMPHAAVHFPLYPADEFTGGSTDGLLRAWVREVDRSVGRVLDAVRDAGIADRTLVLFTSDNGGSLPNGSDNGPLRGGKGSTWEGGVRVPTIAWWPGRVPAGTSTDAVAGMIDVLPTFAVLAGAAPPAGRTIDGRDLTPLLVGDAASPHPVYPLFRGLTLEAIRSGRWKLHLAKGELYDLEADLGETRNVAAGHPDVVRRLTAHAESIDADLGRDGVGPGCRPLGRAENPRPLIGPDGAIREGFRGE